MNCCQWRVVCDWCWRAQPLLLYSLGIRHHGINEIHWAHDADTHLEAGISHPQYKPMGWCNGGAAVEFNFIEPCSCSHDATFVFPTNGWRADKHVGQGTCGNVGCCIISEVGLLHNLLHRTWLIQEISLVISAIRVWLSFSSQNTKQNTPKAVLLKNPKPCICSMPPSCTLFLTNRQEGKLEFKSKFWLESDFPFMLSLI